MPAEFSCVEKRKRMSSSGPSSKRALIQTRQPGVAPSLLHSGSTFRGQQRSRGNSYQVDVVLQHVDEENDFLCGYFTIYNLTKEYPTLTSYFEGEIIGEKHPFLTRKWEAKLEVDQEHWSKFPSFSQFADSFNADEFEYDSVKESDFVYMRWKEHFLVPDHKITQIHGASFEGFYYICFQKSTARIDGYYYHKQSEMFQSLKLHHVAQTSIPVFEFR